MVLQAPDPNATRARAADWLELSALAAGKPGYSYGALMGALEMEDESVDFEDEGERLDGEILQSKHDPFVDGIISEIEWRADVLGDSYPFRLVRTGPSWRLVYVPRGASSNTPSEARLPASVYTTCLLIAGLRYGLIDERLATEFTPKAPETFQVLASLVARGTFGGATSFWMGHPRPEHDGYGDALKRLVGEIGVGMVKNPYPPSQQGRNKDGGIDVIAWRGFRDNRPTPFVIYGQVASGKEWKDKSVQATLDSHFHHWMIDNPVKYFLPAMYIPFVQHEDVRARVGADYEAVARDNSVTLEMRLGLVVDRLRLTELTPVAIEHAVAPDRERFQLALGWMLRLTRSIQRGTFAAPATV